MKEFNDVYKQIDGISKWLREYDTQAGTSGYVIGLSGGIDSTLVAHLAVKAVGVKNVIGVIMPIYSPEKDEADAYRVANRLSIEVVHVDLKHTYNEIVESMSMNEVTELGRLEKANIRSRLRMVALYAIAGNKNMLVAGTGNKSEDMIGYFTKYGDGGVDILPIADFYKWEVREMAKYLEIPNEIIEKTPSAGLWEGQTDEGELGMTYDELDSILDYLEGNKIDPFFISAKNLSEWSDKVEKIKDMINKNKHKTEYPPIYRRK